MDTSNTFWALLWYAAGFVAFTVFLEGRGRVLVDVGENTWQWSWELSLWTCESQLMCFYGQDAQIGAELNVAHDF